VKQEDPNASIDPKAEPLITYNRVLDEVIQVGGLYLSFVSSALAISQTQRDHEEFCAKTLVSLCGEHVQFGHRGNDQTDPDMIFSAENESLGIEVTSAFFRGDESDPNAHAREAFEFAENPTFDDNGRHVIWEGTNPYLRLEQNIKIQLGKNAASLIKKDCYDR
jgi:hypothetical protein